MSYNDPWNRPPEPPKSTESYIGTWFLWQVGNVVFSGIYCFFAGLATMDYWRRIPANFSGHFINCFFVMGFLITVGVVWLAHADEKGHQNDWARYHRVKREDEEQAEQSRYAILLESSRGFEERQKAQAKALAQDAYQRAMAAYEAKLGKVESAMLLAFARYQMERSFDGSDVTEGQLVSEFANRNDFHNWPNAALLKASSDPTIKVIVSKMTRPLPTPPPPPKRPV